MKNENAYPNLFGQQTGKKKRTLPKEYTQQAFLEVKSNRTEIEAFKAGLMQLLNRNN